MTAPLEQAAPPRLEWSGFHILVALGMVCALLVVAVYRLAAPIIAEKRNAALQEAVFDVLPGAHSKSAFRWTGDGRFEPWHGARMAAGVVYAGYGPDQRLVGLAIPAAGMGYQDRIALLYGYSPAQQAIVGLRILESRETPGLGGRIRSDPDFLASFERLDVSLTASGRALEHPIELTPRGGERRPGQIDAISGATVSSRSVADILRHSTRRWIPRLARHLEEFARGDPAQ